jgi:hypothetical protein
VSIIAVELRKDIIDVGYMTPAGRYRRQAFIMLSQSPEEIFMKAFYTVVLFLFIVLPSPAQDEPIPLNVFYGEIPDGDRILYVAPDGDNDSLGTEEEPWATLDYAVSQAQQGDVIVLRGGVYMHNDIIRINTPQGTVNQRIVVTAYPGEVPILDFSGQPKVRDYHGIRLNANYWHLIGITIRYASHNGIRMDGAFNILEQLTAYGNHDTGIHMAGGASYNLIKNCDSFHNFNYDVNRTPRIGNNADGFGAKFVIGPGNQYYGCRAWENSDDGFDFWEAANTIIVENCWAFGNGDASVFGDPENFEGNGNGFKLGGNFVEADHTVLRSLAFDNFGANGQAKGFDYNNNPGAMTLIHNTAYNNGRNYFFPLDAPSGKQALFVNNLSVVSGVLAVTPPSAMLAGNSWQTGVTVTTDMFRGVDTEMAKSPRQQDGSLPDTDLLKPTPESFIVDGGVAFSEPFYGTAPDIGAYEYQVGDPVQPWINRGSGNLITDLLVYDMDNAESWSIADSFDKGQVVYGDADYTITAFPAMLIVEEWIPTSLETRTKNYLQSPALFTVTEDTYIFIAHPDAIITKPAWLSAYEITDMKITVSGESDHEFTLYKKEATADEQIALGRNSNDGTSDALMYFVLAGTIDPVSVEVLPEIPADFVLMQNFPNPFNPSTTIQYGVPKRTQVTLTIYDVMGREIAELVNGDHEAGLYRIVWNAQGVASGIYYCRIATGEFSAVRKLILMK